jgi:integrase/recombinase XerC
MANRIRCDPATGVVSRAGTAFVLASEHIGLVPGSGSRWVRYDRRALTRGWPATLWQDRIRCDILAADAASDGGGLMTRQDVPAGSASLVLADGVPLLHPDTQLFEAMLEGWRNQMLARNLAPATIRNQTRQVRAFTAHTNEYPWQWSWSMADEWFADLRSVRHVSVSTLRGYQVAIRGFCRFITDPAYGWANECERRFGTHPVQVITEVNSAMHAADSEADPKKRAFTRPELQALFDYADEQVALKRSQGRKGWLPAFRDATLLKVAYGFGLRRNETRMLDAADFGRNPHGPEFGDSGPRLASS